MRFQFLSFTVFSLMLIFSSGALRGEESFDSRKIRVWEYPDQKREGTFVSLSESGLLFREKEDEKSISRENLIRVTFPETEIKKISGSSLVLLENGDRLFVRVEKIEDDLVLARWNNSKTVLKIPLETVRAILFRYSGKNESSQKLLAKIFRSNQNNDFYILDNDDTLSGELKEMDSKGVSISSRSGDRVIPASKIAAIAMNRELVSFPGTQTKHQIVQFKNGSWLNCHSVKFDQEKRVHFQSVAGIEFSLDSEEVRAITFLSSRVQSLSERKHASYQYVPYLSQKRLLKVNRNNLDHFLTIKGVEYPSGLGTYSQSSVSWQLEGQFLKLFGISGIDDEAGQYGSVIFSVEADKKKIFESSQITRESPSVKIENLNLGRCNELKLTVEFGDFGDIHDLANWCDLIVIK